MSNVHKTITFGAYNASSSAQGPSVAEIRNVEVQKNAPAVETHQDQVSRDKPTSVTTADDEEEAA